MMQHNFNLDPTFQNQINQHPHSHQHPHNHHQQPHHHHEQLHHHKNTGNNHHNHNHHHHHQHHQNQRAGSKSASSLTHYKYHNDSHSSVLTYEQVKRLDHVMDQIIPIHGRGNFPTLYVKLKELICLVKTKLQEKHSIEIRDIRLNGSAASYILAPENSQYNDLDLVFATDLSGEDKFDVIREVVLDCLKEFFPNQQNTATTTPNSNNTNVINNNNVNQMPFSSCAIKEAYVHKMVKVNEGDRWSLISLGVQQYEANVCRQVINYNDNQAAAQGRNGQHQSLPASNHHHHQHYNHHHHHQPQAPNNIELKFVDRMRRKFEFSVDSFQIILDSLLQFYDCAPTVANHYSYLSSNSSVSASTSSVASSSGCSSSSSIVSSSSSVSCDGDYEDLYGSYDNDNLSSSSSSSLTTATGITTNDRTHSTNITTNGATSTIVANNNQNNINNNNTELETNSSCAVISKNFYPTVIGQSEYGNFKEALYHLENKLIATRSPEEIRGGGLLKYCNLLARNYKPTNNNQMRTLERYMCSRFFIDFSDLSQQQAKLESYLANHFSDDALLKFDYLTILFSVVQRSTVCLMSHELRLTLNMVRDLAYKIDFDHRRQQQQDAINHQHHRQQQQQQNHHHHHHNQRQHHHLLAVNQLHQSQPTTATPLAYKHHQTDSCLVAPQPYALADDQLDEHYQLSSNGMERHEDQCYMSNELQLLASKESPDSLLASDNEIVEDDTDDGVLSYLINDSASINDSQISTPNLPNSTCEKAIVVSSPMMNVNHQVVANDTAAVIFANSTIPNNNPVAVVPNSCCHHNHQHHHGCVTLVNGGSCHINHARPSITECSNRDNTNQEKQRQQQQLTKSTTTTSTKKKNRGQHDHNGKQQQQKQQQQLQQPAPNRVVYFKLLDCMECRCRYLAIQSCSLCAGPVHLTIA